MSDRSERDVDLQRLKEAVSAVVESGDNLRRRTRDLMLTAFASAHLDLPAMRQVTAATLESIGAAAHVHGDRTREVARQSVEGVEEALLKAAEASKLAIEEAAGRTAEFSRTDLAKAVDDLGAIEALFMDTLSDVTAAGRDTAAAVFGDLLGHFRNSGSAIGRRIADITTGLGDELPPVTGESLQKGFDMAHATADRLARFASGFLADIRQNLSPGIEVADKDEKKGTD
jgi:Family of unknown function (DUF6781)